jgi:DNA-binding CsgD family transcriptional regulator
VLENGGEVCLEEEVERRLKAGMTPKEIAREMGVDPIWVESQVARLADQGEAPAAHEKD